MYWLFFLVVTIFGKVEHDFHLSKCLIEYNPEAKAVQVSMHLFIDDVELALERQGKKNLKLCTNLEHPNAEEYLQHYITQHFKLTINQKPATYTFLGKEPAEDLIGMWCYLEIENIPNITSLEVTDQILLDTYDDQQNLIQVKVPGKKQGYFILRKGSVTEKVAF